MGEMSIWHWIVVAVLAGVLVAFIQIFGRVVQRAGYSRWWLFVMFVPFVNVIMLWVFAFASWPALAKSQQKMA